MPNFSQLFGGALIVFAAVAPLSYCAVKVHDNQTAIERACMDAKGEWTAGSSGHYCDLRKTEIAKSQP